MRTVLALIALAGCGEAIEPSGSVGDVFRPRAVEASAPAPTPAPTVRDTPDVDADTTAAPFDFEADAHGSDDGDHGETDVLAALGLAEAADVEPDTEADVDADTEAAAPMPVQAQAEAAPAWTPGTPVLGSWGVRLVSTVTNAQPPRAILGLPSGEEVVVEPGTLLPQAQLVVLAIGQDAVQVAEIVPAGDRARVESKMLTALYPTGAPGFTGR